MCVVMVSRIMCQHTQDHVSYPSYVFVSPIGPYVNWLNFVMPGPVSVILAWHTHMLVTSHRLVATVVGQEPGFMMCKADVCLLIWWNGVICVCGHRNVLATVGILHFSLSYCLKFTDVFLSPWVLWSNHINLCFGTYTNHLASYCVFIHILTHFDCVFNIFGGNTFHLCRWNLYTPFWCTADTWMSFYFCVSYLRHAQVAVYRI